MPVQYEKDPYIILGLPKNASDAEIKQKYRRLAREYHPDLNKEPRAAERMKDINWAYSILGDAQQRANYDFWRRASEQGAFTPDASSTPPKRAQTWTTYSSPRPRTNSTGTGLGTILAFWAIYSLISSLLRYSPEPAFFPSINNASQTAQAERIYDFMLTFSTTHQISTPLSSTAQSRIETPWPTQTNMFDAENIRDQVVPGKREWEWIDTLLADYGLTTPIGLSDEVLRVSRDKDGSIFVETRSYGAFFIYLNADLEPAVIPLSITPVP